MADEHRMREIAGAASREIFDKAIENLNGITHHDNALATEIIMSALRDAARQAQGFSHIDPPNTAARDVAISELVRAAEARLRHGTCCPCQEGMECDEAIKAALANFKVQHG